MTRYLLQTLLSLVLLVAAQKMLARQPVLMRRLIQRGSQIGEQVGRRAAEVTIEQMNLQRSTGSSTP
jgi:hypothetical protein